MEYAIFFIAAACAYLVCAINPSILLSTAIYHKDVRTGGSGNAGFTNFKRCFGWKLAWIVLLFDLAKAAVIIAVFAPMIAHYHHDYAMGAAFTGFFCILGHSYPVYYGFKGGKSVLTFLSAIWFIDWRSGLITLGVMVIILLTLKYMSVATVTAMATCPVSLIFFHASVWTVVLCALAVLFIAWRHKENFKRLAKGTESKFLLFKKK